MIYKIRAGTNLALDGLSNRSDHHRGYVRAKNIFISDITKCARVGMLVSRGTGRRPVNPFPKPGHIMKTEVNSVRLLIIIFSR